MSPRDRTQIILTLINDDVPKADFRRMFVYLNSRQHRDIDVTGLRIDTIRLIAAFVDVFLPDQQLTVPIEYEEMPHDPQLLQSLWDKKTMLDV